MKFIDSLGKLTKVILLFIDICIVAVAYVIVGIFLNGTNELFNYVSSSRVVNTILLSVIVLRLMLLNQVLNETGLVFL